MMFRTELPIKPSQLRLALQAEVLTIGSCFAEVIGSKLQENKVATLVNPFGTIFNPLSACLLVEIVSGKAYDFEKHLVQHNGIWYAYDLHSALSSPSKEELLHTIRQQVQQTQEQLQKASLLIMTWGTAVSYRLASTGTVVANCHKLPARQFTRLLLTTEEITAAFTQMHQRLLQLNPNIKLLLTVSPVRHLKETLEINSVSKAVLRVATHQLTEAYENVNYFPAYEIMMDDLRDYRFYKADMLHPTELAEDYIWQKFVGAYFDQEYQAFLPEWEKVRRAMAHKPFHPASAAHQQFLKATLQQLRELEQKHNISCAKEIAQLQLQIIGKD
ncbi:GSCFA domain-containing protein [Pontibacter beigongshangensis]|uniref:GSCFA domain-containing protein n=1 Tax=Pontibacter beigongshangensis TaxID=2574733 RepID=UPI001F512A81|nr:GSCFA domain-containing protein [Pontibacter beigongshangensis]